MADLPQGRRPTPRTSRPLLLATAGLALVKMACDNVVSGNLVAPPPCDENSQNEPYCYGPDPRSDAGADAGTPDGGDSDGGTADGGR